MRAYSQFAVSAVALPQPDTAVNLQQEGHIYPSNTTSPVFCFFQGGEGRDF